MDRFLVLKLWRKFDHRLADHDSDRIEIRSVSWQTKALGFKRDRASTGKWIVDWRQLAVTTLPNFSPGTFQNSFVRRIFPLHQILNDLEQTLALGFNGLFRWELVGMAGRIIHQLREQDRTASRQRTPRPPKMQGRRVPMADRFLACRCRINGLQRDRYLNQFLFVCCHNTISIHSRIGQLIRFCCNSPSKEPSEKILP